MTVDLRLGNSVNLLDGLRPGWCGDRRSVRPFAPPPGVPFVTFPLGEAPSPGPWGSPRVTLHDSLHALVDALFEYRVLAVRADPGFSLPASTLMLGGGSRAAATAALGDLLGIDLARTDAGGFALLQIQREDADIRHDVEQGGIGFRIRIARYWTREGRHAMARLRVTERIYAGHDRRAVITARQAQRYLDYFYSYGTHFVARVGLGDRIFQVLACRADRYPFLKDLWRRETGDGSATGLLAAAFAQFTGPQWICARGPVISLGTDPELARSVREGGWRAEQPDYGDSLLAPFARPPQVATALLGRLRSSVPTRVELMPHGPLMGVFRAHAWQQVFEGALLQRYGDKVATPPGSADLEPCPDLFGPNPRIPALNGGELTLVQDCLESEECVAWGAAEIRDLRAVGLCLTARSRFPVDLPGARATLLAFRTLAGDADRGVPILRVADEAFPRFELMTGEMHGALFLTDRSGSRRDTYFQGLRLGSDSSGRVVSKGDPRQPSAALLRELYGPLECTLDIAEALLASGGTDRIQLTDIARGHLEWVAEMVRRSGLTAGNAPDAPLWSTLRARALCSARLRLVPGAGTAANPGVVRALAEVARDIQELDLHLRYVLGSGWESDAAGAADLAERLHEAGQTLAFSMGLSGPGRISTAATLTRLVEQTVDARRQVCKEAGTVMAHLDGDGFATADRERLCLALEILTNVLCADAPEGHAGQSRPDDPALEGAIDLLTEVRQGIVAIATLSGWLAVDKACEDAVSDEALETLSGSVRWPAEREWRSLIEMLAGLPGASPAQTCPTTLVRFEEAVRSLQRSGADALTRLAGEARERLCNRHLLASASALTGSPHPRLRLQARYWQVTSLLVQACRKGSWPPGDGRPSQPRPDADPRLSLAGVARVLLAEPR